MSGPQASAGSETGSETAAEPDLRAAWASVLRRRSSVASLAKAHRTRSESVRTESAAVVAAPVAADLIPDGAVPASLAAIRSHNAAVRAGLAGSPDAAQKTPTTPSETSGGAR